MLRRSVKSPVLLFVSCCTLTTVLARQPNVVLFLVDDMGWMDSGAYGSKYYETPNIDRLARQAMRFTDAYAVSLCSPTRASILTGQYSARHGITSATGHLPPARQGESPYPQKVPPGKRFIYAESKNYLDPELTTLAEVLKGAGYHTGHFGKWHLGVMPQHRPDKQGFDVAWGCAPDPGPPSYFSPYGVHLEGTPSAQFKVGNITDGPKGEHITDRLTDEALKFVDSHSSEPFYLNLWHYSVHGPWQHKEEYTSGFAKKNDPRGTQANPVMASMLKSVDESLGRILERLDELKLTDNTIFIFYSDNGGNTHSWESDDPKLAKVTEKHPLYETIQSYRKWSGGLPPTCNAPLREGKGHIYEGGQRVPLMIRWPGQIKPESTSDAVVGAIDLYPTILDALSLKVPSGQKVDGVSFLPVLLGTGEWKRKAYFTWFPHLIPAVSVRAGEWKLIRRWEPHPEYPALYELYNLKDDIGEKVDLAKKMPEKVRELDALIDGFVEDTGALVPQPNPDYKAPDPAAGLVPKQCSAEVVDGALRVRSDAVSPFLGTAQVRFTGPINFTLRARSEKGGRVVLRWITEDGTGNFTKNGEVTLDLPAGDGWQELTAELPVKGRAKIIRLYLPAEKSPVEIESIKYTGVSGGLKVWSFKSER